jgi:hypothetical protein
MLQEILPACDWLQACPALFMYGYMPVCCMNIIDCRYLKTYIIPLTHMGLRDVPSKGAKNCWWTTLIKLDVNKNEIQYTVRGHCECFSLLRK